MKNRIAFFLIFSLLLTVNVFSAETTVVSGSELSANAGETAVFDVMITDNPGLAAWLFELEWDSDAFEPIEAQISIGSAFSAGNFLNAKEDDGTLRLVWFCAKNVREDGILFSVPFRIKAGADSGEYPIKLTCSPENTINSSEQTVPVTVQSGSITVQSVGETPSDVPDIPQAQQTPEASQTPEVSEMPLASELPYTDVSEADYFYTPVLWAAENGITSGTTATTFSPAMGCTRAQTVTFLWRAAGSPKPKTTKCPFSDVPSSAYYYKAVLWAAENGITSGTSVSAFSPDAPVTRAQAVLFLQRCDGGAPAKCAAPFSDVAPDAYYADAVSWAVQRGVTNGISNTTFGPEQPCTRAQIVTFLYRYFTA